MIIILSVRNIHGSYTVSKRDEPDGCGDCYNLKTKIKLNWIHFLSGSKHHVYITKTSQAVLHREVMCLAENVLSNTQIQPMRTVRLILFEC